MARLGLEVIVVPPMINLGQVVGPFQFVVGQPGTLTTDNLYLEFDSAEMPDTATVVNALQAAINFLQVNDGFPAT